MNIDLFREILELESTGGMERGIAVFLEKRVVEESRMCGGNACECERYEVGDGTLNLLFKWNCGPGGMPEVCLCTHMDTVPPYIAPTFRAIAGGGILPDGRVAGSSDILIKGRGSNDAKGQIFSMLSACLELQDEGCKGSFGLLLLAGEETGSFGARAYTRDCAGGEWVIVGEPTDNLMVSASKGTKSFRVTMRGKACHSGYPEQGHSAVEDFVRFCEDLRSVSLPDDPVLGPTTWNIGRLASDNPQNILSPELSFRIYFRTTFATDDIVSAFPQRWTSLFPDIEIEAYGGDTPMKYDIFDGYGYAPVSFGSDTPRLTGFSHRAMCGPGSILVAHTDREYVLLSQLERAKEQYKDMIHRILL